MKIVMTIFGISGALFLFSCGVFIGGDPKPSPEWLTRLIQQQDIPSMVYDSKGIVICHPDGGISGKGDMKCPDFFEKRTNEKLIWKDARGYPPEK